MDSKVFKVCLEKYQSRDASVSWEDLARQFGYPSGENLRCAFKIERKKIGIPSHGMQSSVKEFNENKSIDEDNLFQYKQTTEINGNGEVVSDRLIMMCEEETKSPFSILQAHNFDPEKWNLNNCKNSLWHVQKKGGGRLLCYQSKIIVSPKKDNEWTTELLDKLFSNLATKNIPFGKKSVSKVKYVANGRILMVGISDFHLGLLSTEHTSGNDYNVEIAEKIYLETISQIKREIEGQKFEKIALLIGNDYTNFDNTNQSTQHGTLMENDSIWFDIVDKAIELVIKTVEEFLPLGKVDIIYIPSNHDLETFYGVMRAVDLYYRNNNDVTTDYSPLPRKYYQYGKNLFGFAHDIPLKKSLEIMTVEAKEQWSSSEHMFWILAHLHNAMIYEKLGFLEIIRLPTLSGWSRWSNNKGYIQTERKTQCFIVDSEKGIVNTLNIVV